MSRLATTLSPSLSATAFVIVIGSATAAAQSQILQSSGTTDGALFGSSVDGLGDVDGDGYDDFVVGAYGADSLGPETGEVQVISGKNGVVLHTLTGDAAGDCFGYSVSSAGFIDFDNRQDFIVGAPHGGYARVFSGATGAELTTILGPINFSWTVSDVGDVNADGRDDVALGTWDDSTIGTNNGAVRIYSGLDGSLIWELYGNPWERFGTSIAGVGDLDGDQRDDFAVGAIGFDGGTIYVFSGNDANYLHQFHGDAPGDLLGYSIDGGLDLDFDGTPDLVAGAPGHNAWSGYARAYSGLSGTMLFTDFGEAQSSHGVAVAMGRQLSGQDDALVYVGAETADVERGGLITPSVGRVRVLHAASGTEIFSYYGRRSASRFGASVAAAGDADGDGYGDLIAGAPGTNAGGSDRGRSHLLSVQRRGTIATYCSAVPNSSGSGARLNGQGTASVFVNDLRLNGLLFPASTLTLAFYGATEGDVPFGNGRLCMTGSVFRLPPPRTTGGSGLITFFVDLTLPPSSHGAGAVRGGDTWLYQAWFRDTPAGGSGFNTSEAVRIEFLP